MIRCVGRGAYGEVWLARHARLGTLRAVKIIRRDQFDDDRPFQREFNGIRRYEPISRGHPNLVAIIYGLNVFVGIPSFFARRYDRAIEYFEKASQLPIGGAWALELIGRANEEKGDFAAAIEAFQKAERGDPETGQQSYADLRNAYDKSGRPGYWRQKLTFAQSEYGGWRAWIDALDIAQIHARLGDADKASEWLEKAFQEKSEFLLWLNVDPGWDNIRSDPRFASLLHRMGLAK